MGNREIDNILAEQAADLQEAVRRAEPGSEQRLAAWLKESKRHVRHYLMMAMLDRELNQIDPGRQWPLPTQPMRTERVVDLPRRIVGPASSSRPSRKMPWSIAAAALLVCGLLTGLYALIGHRSNEYVTAPGEQRKVELADGSVLYLNTESRINVVFGERSRDIRLLSGEALFRVEHDENRPFRVYTDDAVITAVGTEFNVYRRAEGDTRVSVLEGRVQVSSALEGDGAAKKAAQRTTMLSAGQQTRVRRGAQIAAVQAPDPANFAAWRQHRLVFMATPLSEMVAEFNRYNRTPHLELADGDVQGRAYTGVFDADDPNSLVSLLESEPGLRIERQEDRVVIRSVVEAPPQGIGEMLERAQ